MDTLNLIIGPDDHANALQMCARAVLLFIVGIIYIRIAGRRTFAQYSPLDIIVALIVGSNLSRLMTGKVAFWPGLAATLTLVLLHRLCALATMRSRWLSGIVRGRGIKIIVDGKVRHAALRRANLSEADLAQALRGEQVDDPAQVELAILEPGGKLSVIPRAPIQ